MLIVFKAYSLIEGAYIIIAKGEIIPLTVNQTINIDGYGNTFDKTITNGEIINNDRHVTSVKHYSVNDSKICGYGSNFFVYDYMKKELTKFETYKDYTEYAAKHDLPLPATFQSLETHKFKYRYYFTGLFKSYKNEEWLSLLDKIIGDEENN